MKPSRNDPCLCGSGKKFKHCCERKAQSKPVVSPPTITEFNQLIARFNSGQLDEVERQARLLTEQCPAFTQAWKLLGICLHRQQRAGEALPILLKATELLPGDAEAHYNLGVTQEFLGLFNHAATSYQKAVRLNPKLAAAHNNLGNVLRELGQLQEAAISCRRALTIRPDYAGAYLNLGNTLREMGQYEQANINCKAALRIQPDFFDAYHILLLGMNYTAHKPEDYLAEALRFGEVASQKASPFTDWRCEREPQKLRVGLVSGDLRNHPVGYFAESLIAQLDPERIALFAYSNHPKADELTQRIRPYFVEWNEVSALRDDPLAHKVHSDGIHVLIDLSGHTGHCRLPIFAWKPAPIQVSWLGLPNTTGMAEMDYVLGDPIATPPEDASHFCEKIWRLPETYICLSAPESELTVSALPALDNGFITFASFNNLSKVNDATIAVWARILHAVTASRLFLKTKQLRDTAVKNMVVQRFAAHGIGEERLILEGPTAQRSDHLAIYHRVDIGLDPFPYPGVTTSAEALWMGIPVLSMQGDRFMSRTATSIAYNAGLPDWVANDEDDYVSKAVQFASDLPKLAALRAALREQVRVSPLFDAPRFARHFEQALWGMWQAKMQGVSQ